MTSNNNDFFGQKANPVNLLAAAMNEALAKSTKDMLRDVDFSALNKNAYGDVDFSAAVKNLVGDLGSNFAAKGQGFFEGFNVPGAEQKTTVAEFTPAVDVILSDTVATYIVGAPGVRQEDVTVELEDAKLTISIYSERIITSDEPTRNWKGGAWAQTFTVPTGTVEAPKKIDEENISAVVENGLITVLVGYKAPKVTKIKVG